MNQTLLYYCIKFFQDLISPILTGVVIKLGPFYSSHGLVPMFT